MFGRKKFKEMQSLIDESRKSLNNAEHKVEELMIELKDANTKIKQRDKIIEKQEKQIKELKSKNKDLNNNIELLYNNLSPRKKAAIEKNNSIKKEE